MSDLESIIAVSEPFEEEFEANALGSIEAEEVKKNKKKQKKKKKENKRCRRHFVI